MHRCRTVPLLALTLTLLFCGTSTAAQPPSKYESFHAEMTRVGESLAGRVERVPEMQKVYDRDFSPIQKDGALRRLGGQDLKAVFDAASSMAFYRPDGPAMQDMRADYAELARRRLIDEATTETYYDALFQSRDFAAMKQLGVASGLPKGSDAIELLGSESPSGLHRKLAIVDRTHLRASAVDVDSQPTIVVISHPLCHFTARAEAAIESDPQLASIFDNHSVWIAPPDRNLSLEPFTTWDEAHPKAHIDLAGTEAGWPEVGEWQTPTFLFFRNGKVVARVTGWGPGGEASAIKAAWAEANR